MIEQHARVQQVENGYALLEITRQSTCGGCEQGSNCGTALFGRYFGQRAATLRVQDSIGLQANDEVLVGLPEQAMLNGSLRLYALPLFTFLMGSILASQWAANAADRDIYSIAGGVMGLSCGLLFNLIQSQRNSSNGLKLIRKITHSTAVEILSIKSV